ncbi:MAG: DUF6748 domain-containing protein, partial [Candidatus Binatia bacterium]
MRNFTYMRVALVAVAFAALMSIGASLQSPHAAPERQPLDHHPGSVLADSSLPEALINSSRTELDNGAELIPSSREPVSGNSTFYTVRPDLRRCASPMCGGYYVRPVNKQLVPCANGRLMAECYVGEIDWNGQSQ